MKTLSIALCFFMVPGVVSAAPPFPKVLSVEGRVHWTDKDGRVTNLKANQGLIEKATIETEAGAKVRLAIDATRKLELLPGSRLEIPAISWETGDAPLIVLKKGRLRWQEEPLKTYNIALRSDLFEFISPVGDFVFQFDPETAVAEVKALKGQMGFSALNAEDIALVTEGQKCSFQGVLEGDQIVYDILLKGKKIPRGKLGLVTPMTEEEKKPYLASQVKASVKKKKQGLPVGGSAAAVLTAGANSQNICSAPGGQLNQCAWFCDNNPKKEKKICRLERAEVRCLRKRCNANGEWSEETEVSKEKAMGLCRLQPVVKDCDY